MRMPLAFMLFNSKIGLAVFGLLIIAICACRLGGGSGGPTDEYRKDAAFAYVKGGYFKMGDSIGEGFPEERPVRRVFVDHYYIKRFPVSFNRWQEVYLWAVDNGYEFANSGTAKGKEHPVVGVSWYDVIKWCNAWSEMEGLQPIYFIDREKTDVYRRGIHDVRGEQVKWAGSGYRLPTEAEWEKAARGGLAGKRFPWGNEISHDLANYLGTRASRSRDYDRSAWVGPHPDFSDTPPFTNPPKFFEPNDFGLFDMAGNVFEWGWDWFYSDYYEGDERYNPKGPANGDQRATRGGCSRCPAFGCRVSFRGRSAPANISEGTGFRPVKGAETASDTDGD